MGDLTALGLLVVGIPLMMFFIHLDRKVAAANKKDYDAAVAERRGRPKAGLYVLYSFLLYCGIALLFIPVFLAVLHFTR